MTKVSLTYKTTTTTVTMPSLPGLCQAWLVTTGHKEDEDTWSFQLRIPTELRHVSAYHGERGGFNRSCFGALGSLLARQRQHMLDEENQLDSSRLQALGVRGKCDLLMAPSFQPMSGHWLEKHHLWFLLSWVRQAAGCRVTHLDQRLAYSEEPQRKKGEGKSR